MRTLFILAAVALAAAGAHTAPRAGAQADTRGDAPRADLTASERALVEASRAAIVGAGVSADYFDRHFRVARVADGPGDRRVVWTFAVGGHEATVVDALGFYTDAGGRRVDTHTVAGALGRARDIRRTITRRRAERLMRACIGEFEGGAVVYQAAGDPPRAALVFTAVSSPRPEEPGAAQSPATPSTPAAAPQPQQQSSGHDVIKQGGKKKPFLFTGAVDLETGRCTKGVAQVGSPMPTPAETRPGGARVPRR
ncbi:MAG TPA: hypothetical protein VF668_23115 [Pyrinomonadaceae bacterium]|jgi:hypothetical protein